MLFYYVYVLLSCLCALQSPYFFFHLFYFILYPLFLLSCFLFILSH